MPDEPRQPLRAAAAGDQAELDLRLSELRVVGDDADVAAHRELEPAAEAEAVDRGDERRAGRVHAVPELLDPARRASLGAAAASRSDGNSLMSAPATNARSPAPSSTIARDAVVGVEPVDLGLELLEERRRERVHRAGCRS